MPYKDKEKQKEYMRKYRTPYMRDYRRRKKKELNFLRTYPKYREAEKKLEEIKLDLLKQNRR